MKEFMLLIRNEIDHQASWSPEQHRQFLKKCEACIVELIERRAGLNRPSRLYGRAGLSQIKMSMKDGPFNETKEVIVGYFHILAEDLNGGILP